MSLSSTQVTNDAVDAVMVAMAAWCRAADDFFLFADDCLCAALDLPRDFAEEIPMSVLVQLAADAVDREESDRDDMRAEDYAARSEEG